MPTLRSLLIAPSHGQVRWPLEVVTIISTVFIAVFVAYAVGFFQVSGGVVFLPGAAAVVGITVGVALGYWERGLLYAWLTVNAALWGYAADHYLLSISHLSVPERVVALVDPNGIAYLAVMALVLGTGAWLVGVGLRWIIGQGRIVWADVVSD